LKKFLENQRIAMECGLAIPDGSVPDKHDPVNKSETACGLDFEGFDLIPLGFFDFSFFFVA